MISIRTATIQDAALIAGISRETFYDTYAEYNTKADMDKFLSEQFTTEQLIAQVGQPFNVFLLAYIGDELAGYIFLKDNTHEDLAGNALEINRFYARRLFIGKGIGKALMQAAIAHAIKEKKETIWLIVWQQNLRAIQFYTSFGFEIADKRKFILGNDVQDDWEMRKTLFC